MLEDNELRLRPRSGRLNLAQHFSAGLKAVNYSKARFSGRKIRKDSGDERILNSECSSTEPVAR
jgi:hypothetical protein